MEEDILVLDIETKTFGSPDPEKDVHRVTGMYSYKTGEHTLTTNIDKIQKMVDSHRVIVGHNIIDYDRPILERVGINFKYKKMIDTYVIAKKRLNTLMRIDPKSYSLRNLAKDLNLEVQKGDIDYKVFKKEPKEWTAEEKKEIAKYLKGDIDTTKALFEKFYNQFIVFKQFVNEKNQDNWSWLTCASGALSYKIICNFAGIEEKYSQEFTPKEEIGGFVLEPTGEEYEDVWYLDFSSLYPNIFSMFNLWGHPTLQPNATRWFTGNNVFKIKGRYACDEQHIISKKWHYMFCERIKIKKSNPKLAYAYKIILNGGYGVARSIMFLSSYYEHTGADCCRIGQTMNKLIGTFFEEAGFKSVAGDTDSRFLKYDDKNGTLTIELQYKLLQETKQKLLDYINANVPFPNKEFDLESETGDKPIKYIKFTKEGDKFLKKNYFYIANGKAKVVGLPIKKKTATGIGQLLLEKYLKPELLKRGKSNFTKNEIMNWAYIELKNDIKLASMEWNVKPYKSYKSKGCIQARISKEFFGGESGRISLIKNNCEGELSSGKSFYSSVEKAKHLNVDNIDFEKLETEIKPFIKMQKTKSLFDF